MAVAGTQQPWLNPENKPLLLAALISVIVHALAFWLLVVLALASVLFSPSKREALAEMLRTQAARARTPPQQEPQLVFVQVDPSQAVKDAPKNAKYYSAQNSRAANADSDADTGTPKIDGKQENVPKTEDTQRQKAFPLQPSPPKETPQPEKNQDNAAQPPGDLAMLNPALNKPTETPQIAPERPHTLEEARMMAGEKMKEDGGVKRSHVAASFDAIGSPFGEYDERVINAIEQHWYDLIDSRNNSTDHGGRVVVRFRLHYDGRVTDLRVVQSDVGELLSSMCISAISDPAPYERWPEPMYRKIKVESGVDYRDVQFTFFYEW
jgi:outer membrane biosynthesis protein TonB